MNGNLKRARRYLDATAESLVYARLGQKTVEHNHSNINELYRCVSEIMKYLESKDD